VKAFPSAAALLALTVALTGCESVRSDFRAGVKEKVDGPAFRARQVEGGTREVYESARTAVAGMGFRIVRFGAAQGVIEALNGISTAETLKSSRQIRLQIKISPSGDGSEVSALFTEVLESDFSKGPGRATENSLRDTSLYEVLFRRIAEGMPKSTKA